MQSKREAKGVVKAESGAKSRSKEWRQFSVYLRKATRNKVGYVLKDLDDGRDFSDLVEELLAEWLKSRT